MSLQAAGEKPSRKGLPNDVVAGLFLIALAAVGYAGSFHLGEGEAASLGPGLVPKLVAGLVAAIGGLIMVLGLLSAGDRVERWSLRGPLFVLGGVVVFAATVRTLGLAVAGPLAMIIAAFADRETRLVEVLVFAALMTVLCIGLFKFLLHLPIPLMPFVLGY